MLSELPVAADHAAFAGHFPGTPILPGAALLDEALYEIMRSRRLDLLHWQIASVKFLAPVGPGAALMLDHVTSGSSIRFAIHHATVLVASGLLSECRPRSAAAHGH